MGSRSRQLVFLTCCLVLLAGCGELRPPGATGSRLLHTVVKGDTLYSIAWQYGYDYRQVAAWNDINEPYQIFPGQRLVIIAPDWRRIADRPPPARPVRPEPVRTAAADRPAATQSAAKRTEPASSSRNRTVAERKKERNEAPKRTKISWEWPTDGDVVERFSNRKGRKGINIQGRTGQAIIASADGAVVYSGDGLIGYGNLVIIKHDDVYLSAYAHNRKLLVKEGDKVRRGEKIAEMGHTLKRGSILHFEIRRNGKPVDPMGFLSPR